MNPPDVTSTSIVAAPLSRLLKGFRLAQYQRKMSDLGYSDDILRLALISHRERDEMMD